MSWVVLLALGCRSTPAPPEGASGASTQTSGVDSVPMPTGDSVTTATVDTGPWAEPWSCGPWVGEYPRLIYGVGVVLTDDAISADFGVVEYVEPPYGHASEVSDPGYSDCMRWSWMVGPSGKYPYAGAAHIWIGEREIVLDVLEGTSLNKEPGYDNWAQTARSRPDFDIEAWLDLPVYFALDGDGAYPGVPRMWVGRTPKGVIEFTAPERGSVLAPDDVEYRWTKGSSVSGKVQLSFLGPESPTYVDCLMEDTGSWRPPPSSLEAAEPYDVLALSLRSDPSCQRDVGLGVVLASTVAFDATPGPVYVDPASVP